MDRLSDLQMSQKPLSAGLRALQTPKVWSKSKRVEIKPDFYRTSISGVFRRDDFRGPGPDHGIEL